jgi:hypothetical protein
MAALASQPERQSLFVVEITPTTEMRVVTENSIWLLRPDTFMRMPKVEVERAPFVSIDGAGTDHEWRPYDQAWILDSVGAQSWLLRVLPSGRPVGSYGLLSSPILSISERLP